MAIEQLREINSELSTDNDHLWQDVVATVIGIGLLVRFQTHFWTAAAAHELGERDLSREWTDKDISFASPMVDLDGHPADAAARVFTCGVGIWALQHIAMPQSYPVIEWWLTVNLAVLAADPLWFLLHRHTKILGN